VARFVNHTGAAVHLEVARLTPVVLTYLGG
jgi:hypothetical protein